MICRLSTGLPWFFPVDVRQLPCLGGGGQGRVSSRPGASTSGCSHGAGSGQFWLSRGEAVFAEVGEANSPPPGEKVAGCWPVLSEGEDMPYSAGT